MYSGLPARNLAKDVRTKMARQQKKTDKGDISERHLSLEQKLLFQAAKRKELQSFFENQVWEFDKASNAEPARTMTARMLLKWSKNEDGSPRAKARLIVRGYSDVDALQGTLETSSPTTTRLSRNFSPSLSTILRWQLWTSDMLRLTLVMSLYLTMVHLVGSHLPLLVRSCLMRLSFHPSLPPFCRVLALCVLVTLSLKE